MPNIYNNIFTRGTKNQLNSSSVIDGKIRFTTDTEQLFFDLPNNNRVEITDIIRKYTDNQIKQLSSPLDKFYFATDTKIVYFYNKSTSSWNQLPSNTPIFNEAQSRENINSGETMSIILGKIKKWFSSLGGLAFKNSISILELDQNNGLDFGDEDD